MQELSGGGPVGNGEAPQRIEAGPGGYENGGVNGYGEGERDLKLGNVDLLVKQPHGNAMIVDDVTTTVKVGEQHLPGLLVVVEMITAAMANEAVATAELLAALLHGNDSKTPPPPPNGQQGYGYGGYPGGGYGDSNSGYSQSGMGAPPGLGGGSGGLGAPPGLSALFQQYSGSPANGAQAPPPPPPGDAPPPPVSF